MKPTIAIAGATGFIGRWFIASYAHKYNIVALSRNDMEPPAGEGVVWKKVDLYSVRSTTEAIRGADYALYLVHSMQPSTRLNQSHFEDTDLLLADNFSRAAETVGLKQIIFMGGILPKDESQLSTHLRSRYEVELTLGSRSAALTALRAGIIVGPGGSSFEIIEKLVTRLPVMLCPEWTKSETQPVALADVLEVVDYCFGNAKAYDEAIEIGTTEQNTYMGMLRTTAKMLGKRRFIRSVPVFSLGLSKLWVAVFSDSSTTFVSPLIESLRHKMTVEEHPLINALGLKYKTFEEAVEFTLKNADKVPQLPKSLPGIRAKNTVRSVQRLSNPGGKSAEWVAKAYLTWLPDAFRYLIKVNEEADLVSFQLFGRVLLKLRYATERSDEDRQVFYIVGGLLAGKEGYGWLEFRSVLEGRYIVVAIHEFVPRLPWYLYVNSQALLHLWVMNRFGKFLSRQPRTEI